MWLAALVKRVDLCQDDIFDQRVKKFTNAGWALLGSPGAKGQQSSAGDSEKNNEEIALLYRSAK